MTQSRLQEAAYQGPALEVDSDFYSQIGEDTDSREIIDEFTIPIRSGQAWDIPPTSATSHRRRPAGPATQSVESPRSRKNGSGPHGPDSSRRHTCH